MDRHIHVEIIVESVDENADAEVLDLVKRFGAALQRRNRRSMCIVSAHEVHEEEACKAADPATIN